MLSKLFLTLAASSVAFARDFNYEKTDHWYGLIGNVNCEAVYPSISVIQPLGESCNPEQCTQLTAKGDEDITTARDCEVEKFQLDHTTIKEKSIVASYWLNSGNCGLGATGSLDEIFGESEIISISPGVCFPREIFSPSTSGSLEFDVVSNLNIKIGGFSAGQWIYFECGNNGPIAYSCSDNACQTNCKQIATSMVENKCSNYTFNILDTPFYSSVFTRCSGKTYVDKPQILIEDTSSASSTKVYMALTLGVGALLGMFFI